MSKIILTRGAPASGKTTWAVQFVKDNPDFINVNRDNLREMLFPAHYGNGVYKPSRAREESVTLAQFGLAKENAIVGKSIIVSDTNLNQEVVRRWQQFAKEWDLEFSIKDFYEDLDVLLDRNAKRDGGVPPRVIHRMYYMHVQQMHPDWKYEPKPGTPPAIIVDVDGTLANHEGIRSPYDASKVHLDEPHQDIIDLVGSLSKDHDILIMTGRDGSAAEATAEWLYEHGVDYRDLFIRSQGDNRKDSIIKKELFDNYVRDQYDVRYVIDDRLQVIHMWRALGLRVLDVSGGMF